jgi:hypothetical protein
MLEEDGGRNGKGILGYERALVENVLVLDRIGMK